LRTSIRKGTNATLFETFHDVFLLSKALNSTMASLLQRGPTADELPSVRLLLGHCLINEVDIDSLLAFFGQLASTSRLGAAQVQMVQWIVDAYKDYLHDKTVLFTGDESAHLEDQRAAKGFRFFTMCGGSAQKRVQLPWAEGGEAYMIAGGELLRCTRDLIEMRNYTHSMLREKQRIYAQCVQQIHSRGISDMAHTITTARDQAQTELMLQLARRREFLAESLQRRKESELEKKAESERLERLQQDKAALDVRVQRLQRALARQRNRVEAFRQQGERLRYTQRRQLEAIAKQLEQEQRFLAEGDMSAVHITSWMQHEHSRHTDEKHQALETVSQAISDTSTELVAAINVALMNYSKVLGRLEELLLTPMAQEGANLAATVELIDRRIHALRQTVSELTLADVASSLPTILATLDGLVRRNDEIKQVLQEQLQQQQQQQQR